MKPEAQLHVPSSPSQQSKQGLCFTKEICQPSFTTSHVSKQEDAITKNGSALIGLGLLFCPIGWSTIPLELPPALLTTVKSLASSKKSWFKYFKRKNCRRKFALSAFNRKSEPDKQPFTPHLDLLLLFGSHYPLPTPALIADAQSPLCVMEATWGVNCLFHEPNNYSRASISPLSHIHHAPIQPLPQLPSPGMSVKGEVKHTGFKKEKAKQNPWQHQ